MYISEIQMKSTTPRINVSASPTNYTCSLNYPYSWEDASSGSELVLGDDDYISTMLPFNFSFYDAIFREITITTEGYLTFSFKSIQTTNMIPSNHPHRQKIIAPYCTNLNGASGKIYVKNFSSYWVVAWENFDLSNGSFAGTFETVLFDDGNIVFNYDILENVSVYACGMNYGDGSLYNSITTLFSGINDFSIKFSSTNGNIGVTNNNIDAGAILAVIIPIGVVALVSGLTLFYYRKNPERFKANLQDLKGKFTKGSERIKDGIKKGSKQIKNGVKKIKEKIPSKTESDN
ncbi:MAG: hypothetical protein ACFFKA_14020 [Candidatus Thorarchaeota archaeon]